MVDENDIVDSFVSAIKSNISGLKTVEAFEGTLDDAVGRLRFFPAILVLLESIVYADEDESGDLLGGEPVVALLIGQRSLRSKDEVRRGAYDVMKSCRALLHNSSVGVENATFKIKDQRLLEPGANFNIFVQRYRGENVYFS